MTDYSQSFLATWGVYPKRNGMKRGKSTAFAEWEKLDLEEQRQAYSDIKSRNLAGGWEFIRDMERYLKRREWEDEWQGQKVTSDMVDVISRVTLENLCDYVLKNKILCEHQLRTAWNYRGPEPGSLTGVQIPECGACNRASISVKTGEVPI